MVPVLAALVALLHATSAHALIHKIIASVVGGPGDEVVGYAVARAGDLNGDGIGDLLVGAPFTNGWKGRVYVLHLGPGQDAVWDRVIEPDPVQSQSGLGQAFIGARDLDGDGHDDIMISAPEWSWSCCHSSSWIGQIYVLPANATTVTQAEVKSSGWGYSRQMGNTLAAIGDWNADGVDEIAIGAVDQLQVWRTGPSLDTIPEYHIDPPFTAPGYEYRVAGAGDFNHDGHPDLLTLRTTPSGYLSDSVEVLLGGPAADLVPDLNLIPSATTGGAFHKYFSSMPIEGGDLDGDGYDDIVIGNQAAGPHGRVDVYRGGPGADGVADFTLFPSPGDSSFGASAAIVGDLDGDGYRDLAVGAARWISAAPRGAVYIYKGGPGFDAVPDDTLRGRLPSDAFGFSIAPLGDVNGDGRDDLAVGSPGDSLWGTWAGRVSIVSFQPGTASVPPPDVVSSLRLAPHANPAHGSVAFDLTLPHAAPVTLTLHDVSGRLIGRVLDGSILPAGISSPTFAPHGLAPGVYLARAAVGGKVATARWSWLGR